ncbi:MAG: IS66 family transposase [Solirubrobacteraceae bacterium]
MLAGNPSQAPNKRLLAHISHEREHLFTFLQTPRAQATNWRAEQAIRPAVVNSKNWGGNRTRVRLGSRAVRPCKLARVACLAA